MLKNRLIPSISLAFVSLFIVTYGTSVIFGSSTSSLIKNLGSWDKKEAKEASEKLGKIGKSVVPELINAMDNKDRRKYATRALREIGQDASDAIPALIKATRDSEENTRAYAVEALGKMVSQADQVLPCLEKALNDKSSDVKTKAAKSLNFLKAYPDEVKKQKELAEQEKAYNQLIINQKKVVFQDHIDVAEQGDTQADSNLSNTPPQVSEIYQPKTSVPRIENWELEQKSILPRNTQTNSNHSNTPAWASEINQPNIPISILPKSSSETSSVTPEDHNLPSVQYQSPVSNTDLQSTTTQQNAVYLSCNNKAILSVITFFYFFITLFGVLKGAKKEAIFFNSQKDYRLHLMIAITLLALTIFFALRFPSDFQYAYAIAFIIIFTLINISVAYYLNKDLIVIPLTVGLSRTTMVFFIPLFICLKNIASGKEKEEKNITESIRVKFGQDLNKFLGSALINGASVSTVRLRNYTQQELISKEEREKVEYEKYVADKDINDGGNDDDHVEEDIGFDNSQQDEYDNDDEKTDDHTYESERASTKIEDDASESPYSILEISENASIAEIKAAYRKKMHQYHPDKTSGLGEKLRVLAEKEAKRINVAYDTIMKDKGQ
jgi:DnaJ-domain-containing protein 1